MLQSSKPEPPGCEQTQEHSTLGQELVTTMVIKNMGLLICQWPMGALLQGVYQQTLGIT